ncbi:hypothetical protein MASR1M31_11110 [Porphyromonadaceae bacterium]
MERERYYFDINIDIQETTHLSEMFNLPFFTQACQTSWKLQWTSQQHRPQSEYSQLSVGKTEINEGRFISIPKKISQRYIA